jgi:hypothetical protein
MKKNDLVVIKLDRPRFLRFGHKALKQLSALTGKGIAQMDMSNFDLEDLEKILFCGLLSDARENNETLKLEDMEDLLDKADSFVEITEKMTEAFNKSFGSGEEKN